MSLNRTLVFKCLRFILLFAILIYYFKPTIDLFESFNKTTIPFSKNYFLFVAPAAISGESDVSDFTPLYAFGLLNKERLTKYHDIDVYDPFLLRQTVERLIAPMQPIEVYSIQYPPIIFALTTPLTYFDLNTAWRIWSFASAICLAIAFVCIAYDALKIRPLLILGLIIFFTSAPVNHNFVIGQTTAFEAAFLALSLRLLINKNYFWAGLIAGLAFLKLQQALIILIPGMCIGRSKFFYGCLLMVILEGLLSVYLVGCNNVLNFIRTNYLCEITHTYVGLNETWSMLNFRGLLGCLLDTNAQANMVAAVAYIFVCIISVGLWIKVYPSLEKTSKYAFELIASIGTVGLVCFSLHGYFYDYLIMVIPITWVYLWSTTNDASYTTMQTGTQLIITLITFALPFLCLTNLDLGISENTDLGYQLRLFFGSIALLTCAITGLLIELKQMRKTAVFSG